MKEKTIVVLRFILDHLAVAGGVWKVVLTPDLLQSAAAGRQAYQLYLDEEKRKKEKARQTWKRSNLQDEVDQLKAKRK